jgi:hypothetical protein
VEDLEKRMEKCIVYLKDDIKNMNNHDAGRATGYIMCVDILKDIKRKKIKEKELEENENYLTMIANKEILEQCSDFSSKKEAENAYKSVKNVFDYLVKCGWAKNEFKKYKGTVKAIKNKLKEVDKYISKCPWDHLPRAKPGNKPNKVYEKWEKAMVFLLKNPKTEKRVNVQFETDMPLHGLMPGEVWGELFTLSSDILFLTQLCREPLLS